MPDVTLYYKLVMESRRRPALHRFLRGLRVLLREKIPMLFVNLLRILVPARIFRLGPPRGSFTIYLSLCSENRRPGRVVLTDQGVPEVSPDSLIVASRMNHHTTQPWPVFWSHHKNARLVASTLALMDDRKRICRESVYGDLFMEGDPAWRYTALPKAVTLSGNWTSIVSRWCSNESPPPFSHWIQDALPRLALLKEFPPDTRVLVQSRLAGYQKETLKMLGLLDRIRYTPEKHVIVEDYFFSSPTAMIACYNPYAVDWLRSTLLPLADKSYQGPKRFVIQRKGKTRGILNEAEVNAFFQKLGWAIVDTEQMTFAQELELFSKAEAIAGIFGSGFTNALWSSPGCKVITFVADSFMDGGIETICIANKLDYHWAIFPSDHEMRSTVDIEGIKKLLREAGLDAG